MPVGCNGHRLALITSSAGNGSRANSISLSMFDQSRLAAGSLPVFRDQLARLGANILERSAGHDPAHAIHGHGVRHGSNSKSAKQITPRLNSALGRHVDAGRKVEMQFVDDLFDQFARTSRRMEADDRKAV